MDEEYMTTSEVADFLKLCRPGATRKNKSEAVTYWQTHKGFPRADIRGTGGKESQWRKSVVLKYQADRVREEQERLREERKRLREDGPEPLTPEDGAPYLKVMAQVRKEDGLLDEEPEEQPRPKRERL